jgi:hypothetical protein
MTIHLPSTHSCQTPGALARAHTRDHGAKSRLVTAALCPISPIPTLKQLTDNATGTVTNNSQG